MMKEKKVMRRLVCIGLVVLIICALVNIQKVTAQTEKLDYVLKDAEVTLNGENDGEAIVEFSCKSGGTIKALQGTWSTSESENTNYIALQEIIPAEGMNVQQNNASEGKILYADLTGVGVNVSANDAICKAKYKVDKETPEGTYTIGLKVEGIDNTNNTYDIDGEEQYTATITVTRDTSNTPLVATFSGDSGVGSIDVYYQKNCSGEADEKNVASTKVRNGDTGEFDLSGNGQVNFKVNLNSGYVITSITATNETYTGTIKGPADTGKENTYSITKINSNTTITITTAQRAQFIGTFTTDSGIQSIDVFHTQNYVTPDETNVTQASVRNGENGQTTTNGLGQISFRVNPKSGYYIEPEDITVNGIYRSISKPSDTGYTNVYCITNISGDISISVASRAKISVNPSVSGYEDSYEYTGSSIEPVVNIGCDNYTLIQGTDYSVTYGNNTNVSEGGTIKVSPVETSKYQFNEININFAITAKTITDDNVSVQSTITYMDGEALSPSVTVSVGGEVLQETRDYTVSYAGQTNGVSGYVTVTVNGTGNYGGSVTKNTLIVDKPTQVLSFSEDVVNKKYGDADFTKAVTKTEGDGNVTYSSSNESVATVNPSTGAVTIHDVGEANIIATAQRTANYAETTASYALNVAKRQISISSATVENKNYDGNTNAVVTAISFEGLSNNIQFVRDTQFTVVARFADANVGNNKAVTVEISFIGDEANRYELSREVYTARANINALEIKRADISLDNNTYTYDGNNKEPLATVVVNGRTLTKGTDYTVSYRNNKNAGTAYADVEGIGNYEGSVSVEFSISKCTVVPNVSDIDSQTYSGESIEPEPTVTVEGRNLVKGTDYTITYSDNVNVGDGKADISAVTSGNYEFSQIRKTFTIQPYELKEADVTLAYTTVRWNGQVREPGVTVRVNNNVVNSSNYEVEYSNNVNVGEATVSVTAKNGTNYSGSVSKKFTISEKDVLTIGGVSNNQRIQYTGNPVVLVGSITVSNNTNNIKPEDLSAKYLNEQGDEIERPSDVGKYSVIYSYSDEDYDGSLTVNFEIIKATSNTPAEATYVIKAIKGQTLADVVLATVGLAWEDNTIEIAKGRHTYNAVYTKNGDTTHYTTEVIPVTVYGKSYVNITTSVNGQGGSISESMENVLEESTQTITFTPLEGYEIDWVKVNNINTAVYNNELDITVGNTDMDVVVKYKVIKYKITISATNISDLQSETIDVDYKSNKELELKAKFGYKLTSVKVNGKEMIGSMKNNVLSIDGITSDINIVAVAEKIVYNYTYGANQTYTVDADKDATFIIDADFTLFAQKVYVDGNLVDSSKYIAKSGSTVITLSKDYLVSLEQKARNTVHELNVVFSDGGEATTTFTVCNPNIDENADSSNSQNESTANSNKSTKTGDNIRTYVILLIGAIVLIAVIKKKVIIRQSKAGKSNKRH